MHMSTKPEASSDSQIAVLEAVEENPDAKAHEIVDELSDEYSFIGEDYVREIRDGFRLPDDHPANSNGDGDLEDLAADFDGDVTFHCTLCEDFESTSPEAVRSHINQSTDANHKDRAGSDPGVVEVEGMDYLNELNSRREEGTMMVTDKDFQVLVEIALNPNAGQSEIVEKVGAGSTKPVRWVMLRRGMEWDDRHDLVRELLPEHHVNLMEEKLEEETGDSEESETEDGEETVEREVGNKRYSGPAGGIDLTKEKDRPRFYRTDADMSPEEAIEEARSWKGKKMRGMLVAALAMPTASDAQLARYSGASEGYPSMCINKEKFAKVAMALHESEYRAVDVYEALEDQMLYDHNLLSLGALEELAEDEAEAAEDEDEEVARDETVAVDEPDEDVPELEGWDHDEGVASPDEIIDRMEETVATVVQERDGVGFSDWFGDIFGESDVFVGLTDEQAMALLASDIPDDVREAIYDSVKRS